MTRGGKHTGRWNEDRINMVTISTRVERHQWDALQDLTEEMAIPMAVMVRWGLEKAIPHFQALAKEWAQAKARQQRLEEEES